MIDWGCNTVLTGQALSFDNNGLTSMFRKSGVSLSADHEVQARCPDDRQNRVVSTVLVYA